MANEKIKYTNIKTGKTYTGDAARVETLRKNKLTANKFIFENVASTPSEPKKASDSK